MHLLSIAVRYASVQGARRGLVASFAGALLCLTAMGASADAPLGFVGTQLEPVKWTDLARWTADDHLAAFAAFQKSCQALHKIRLTDNHGPIHGALRNVC